METSDSDLSTDSMMETSSDDEENIIYRIRRPKIYKQRVDTFEAWSDLEFFFKFRLSKAAVLELLNHIRNQISSLSNRGGAIKPETKLLLTLRFYATGNILLSVSDFVGVSVASASRIIHLVSNAIASLRADFIIMPQNRQEMATIAEELYAIARFPQCCGVIDCTHVHIISPGGVEAEIYRNRKGYFSLNVQTVSDASLKIRNVVARWPGSCHDKTIFNNSRLKYNFEAGRYRPFHLIGDSGYTLSRHLLTPHENPLSESETLYNESLIRTRNVVERQYGMWKRRFPILSLGIKLSLERAMTVIVATAVLHNLAIEMNEEVPDNFDLEDEQDIAEQHPNIDNEVELAIHNGIRRAAAIQYRNMFIINNFDLNE